MRFDTVHEYTLMGRVHLHYCPTHETLMIVHHTDHNTERLMVEGISSDEMDELRLELNKAHLEATTNVTNQTTPTGAAATEGSN